jgi:glucosamine-6-phosphate deaminase
MRQFRSGELNIEVYPDRAALGRAAGEAAASEIERLIRERGGVAVVFAAAPSQNETHATLRADKRLDWSRVTALHMDEYAGMRPDHPASFRGFLRRSLFDHVPVKVFHEIAGDASDLQAECRRYATLLRDAAPLLCVLGIGENGHLAFNDPPVDFHDPLDVKVVDLDRACREQQVHDGCFATLDEVPRQAITLSVPALMRIPRLVAAVPGPTKARAVKAALEGPITGECPASILRTHPNATLYLDEESAALLS